MRIKRRIIHDFEIPTWSPVYTSNAQGVYDLDFFFRTKYFDKKYIQNINRHQISHFKNIRVRVRVMVFNATFNNISVLVQRSVLLEEETEENHRPVESHWQTLSHNVVTSTPPLCVNRTHKVVVIDTDCIGSYKSNYHKITATTAPLKY